MNERGGWAATIALLIAAIVGVSYLPRKAGDVAKPSGASSESARASACGKTPAGTGTLILSCVQIERRLRRFYPAGVPIPSDGSCYEKGQKVASAPVPAAQPVGFAVAIVPNPVQTHLPLMFDRQIDAIETAAQDTGFGYDGSWFPWYHSDK